MKVFSCVLAAAVLAAGSVMAHAGNRGLTTDFVLASPTAMPSGHALVAPGRLAAVRALRQLDSHFSAATGAQSQALARRGALVAQKQPSLPAGFPLAVGKASALAQVRVGWGFEVYDVLPADLQSGTSLREAARPTGEWRYALLLDGKPVGLVTVVSAGTGWKAVSFGGSGLSRNIGAVVRQYGRRAGWHLRYVRVPQATADFVEVDHAATASRYVPMRAAVHSLHLTNTQPLAGAALMGKLRQSVARHLGH